MFPIHLKFVLKVLGMMHLLESFFMLSATGVAYLYRESDLQPLSLSCGILFGAGVIFYLLGRKANDVLAGRREGILSVALTWLLLSFFGMMPYYLGGYIPRIADAYFETMSGFTTTGATILSNVEALPHGILFWRSLTQWQGGIGIIVFTVALMPLFGGTASQLFDAEISGITHDHFLPRVTQVAKRLSGIYLLLTALLILLLWAGPMHFFDAVNHSFTTVSTGGYSTKNDGVTHWNTPYVVYLVCLFMCLGANNITLLYFTLKGQWRKLLKDDEFRWFYAFIAIATVLVTVRLLVRQPDETVEKTFRNVLFTVISLLSTTGFLSTDFAAWGPFFAIIALILMTVCGCAGSTSGGLKMGRFVILVKNMLNEFKKQTHPNAIIPVRMSGHVIPAQVVQRVQTFAFVYMGLIIAGCTVLLLDGIAFEEAVGVTVSSIGNAGPGLGEYAGGNFRTLPELSKWVCSFLMMTGRLEIFTVLTVLLPDFWKSN